MSTEAVIIVALTVFLITFVVYAKILAAYYLKIINGFVEDSLEQIKELIRWAKESDRLEERRSPKE